MPDRRCCRHGLLVGLACLLLQGPAVAGAREGGGRSRQALLSWDGLDGAVWEAPPRKVVLTDTHQVDGRGGRATVPTPGRAFWGGLAYVCCLWSTVSVIALLYWSRSAAEIASVVLYVLALSTVKVAVKVLFVEYSFNFPFAISAVHLVVVAMVAFGSLFYRRACTGQVIPVPSCDEFFFAILPIAASAATCIGIANNVLHMCSIAFTETLAATQPLMSIPVVLLLGMSFEWWLFLPTCLVVLGCVLCSLGDMHFSALGLALAVLANVLRAAKASLQQKLLTGEQKDRFDPCSLLAWMSLPSVALMVLLSAVVEGRAPLQRMMDNADDRWPLVCMVMASSIPATILNFSQLLVVEGLGAVGSQIVGQLQLALTVIGGVVLTSEKVVPMQISGFVAVLVGTFFYSRWDQATRAACQKQRLYD